MLTLFKQYFTQLVLNQKKRCDLSVNNCASAYHVHQTDCPYSLAEMNGPHEGHGRDGHYGPSLGDESSIEMKHGGLHNKQRQQEHPDDAGSVRNPRSGKRI
jgi:hypothetical protein